MTESYRHTGLAAEIASVQPGSFDGLVGQTAQRNIP